MTINLSGVQNALSAEEEKAARIKNALSWKLRGLGRRDEAIDGANNALESSLPEGAQKSTGQSESP